MFLYGINLIQSASFFTLAAFTILLAGVVTLWFNHSYQFRCQKMLEYILCFKKQQQNVTTEETKTAKDLNDDQGESQEPGDSTGGLVGKFKAAQLKKLEANLTEDQLGEERRIEREQLAIIFEMLKKQEAALNVQEIDESELSAQLRLYR